MKFRYMNIFRETAENLLYLTLPLHLMELGYKIHEGQTYLYAPGEIPVCLLAHVDVVHKRVEPEIFFDSKKGVLWSPDGIGGDDRAGVAGIMELLNRGYKPHVLFLDYEETGCVGAMDAAKELKAPEVNCLIELDRKGHVDACFYDLDNKKFEKYVESFGFKYEWGIYTDICEICPTWGIAGVNLSIGYYNPHTNEEFVRLNEWLDTVNKVEKILKRPPQHVYKYTAKRWGKYDYDYGYNNYGYWQNGQFHRYNDYYDDHYSHCQPITTANTQFNKSNPQTYGSSGLSSADREKLLRACGEYAVKPKTEATASGGKSTALAKAGPVPKYKYNNDPDSPHYGCREYYEDNFIDLPEEPELEVEGSRVYSGSVSKYGHNGYVEKEFTLIVTLAASHLTSIYGGSTLKWAEWLTNRIRRIETTTQDKVFSIIDEMIMEDYNYVFTNIITVK